MCDYSLNKMFHCTLNATSPLCTPVQQQHGWLVYFQAKNQTIAHTVHVQTTLQADADRIHTPHRATTECQNALDPWWWWVHVSNLSFPVEWSKIEIIRSSEFKSCQRNHWPSSIIVKLSQLAWLNSFSWGNGEFVNYDSVKSRYVMRYRKNPEPLRKTHRQQSRADPWQRSLSCTEHWTGVLF